jgi:SAM-dependent methyltransferase
MAEAPAGFPEWFFERADPGSDPVFYAVPRLVTHIDDHAIDAVGALYAELGIDGEVLDLMSSWVSHFRRAPADLTVLGMNPVELERNAAARRRVVHDLNADPQLPFPDESFDAAVCCVSVDYLVRPVEVFSDVARVLRTGSPFVCTFSNRCFPTKAIRGWLYTDDREHCALVARYFELAGRWSPAISERRPTPPGSDPLFAVWARKV